MRPTDGLHAAVTSLQQVLRESAAAGTPTPEAVRARAAAADFPYPELAAQVCRFLADKRVAVTKELSADDISEAFLTLLLDAEAVKALGGGKTQNPWLNVRAVLRNTGAQLGTSLIEVYELVRQTGLGYTPTLIELGTLLGPAAAQTASQGGTPASLAAAVSAHGLTPWQAALLAAWLRRKKPGSSTPSDADLEELLGDPEVLAELKATDGPWDVYAAQSETLRTLRHMGRALADLADSVDG